MGKALTMDCGRRSGAILPGAMRVSSGSIIARGGKRSVSNHVLALPLRPASIAASGGTTEEIDFALVAPCELDIMPHPTHHRTQRNSMITAIALLLVVTIIGVAMSTASHISLHDPHPSSAVLTVDERTYYEFVAPRLDRLVDEINDVVTMVDGKSRDILALTISGNRIEDLRDDILNFGETNGVPQKFVDVHELVVSATEQVTYTFDEARAALRRFNFSQMTTLVTQFNHAAETLHLAQDHMMSLVGIKPAS